MLKFVLVLFSYHKTEKNYLQQLFYFGLKKIDNFVKLGYTSVKIAEGMNMAPYEHTHGFEKNDDLEQLSYLAWHSKWQNLKKEMSKNRALRDAYRRGHRMLTQYKKQDTMDWGRVFNFAFLLSHTNESFDFTKQRPNIYWDKRVLDAYNQSQEQLASVQQVPMVQLSFNPLSVARVFAEPDCYPSDSVRRNVVYYLGLHPTEWNEKSVEWMYQTYQSEQNHTRRKTFFAPRMFVRLFKKEK